MVIGSCGLLRKRPLSPRGRISRTDSQERTLSHRTQPNRSRQRTRDDAITRAASELGSRHLDSAGSEINGSFTLMWKGRRGSPKWIQRGSRTRADWLGRFLGFTMGERTGADRWDGMRRNCLQGHDVHMLWLGHRSRLTGLVEILTPSLTESASQQRPTLIQRS